MSYDRLNRKAMTEDEIRKVAPSVFAVSAHESRSDRFRAIPTIETVRALAKEGFYVVSAHQGSARDESRREFTKHLLRFRKTDEERKLSIGDNFVEWALKNGNDGSCAWELMAAVFRGTCMNGAYVQTQDLDTIKVRHTGRAIDKVIEGTYSVLEYAPKVVESIANWQSIPLAREERLALANSAHIARFGDKDGVVNTPIKVEQLLITRRHADNQNDLWTTFNVIQENVIKGGLSAYRRDEHGNARRATTRQVTGIDQDVKLNKALWVLAERMAELKAA
jgi:hypothetical protein